MGISVNWQNLVKNIIADLRENSNWLRTGKDRIFKKNGKSLRRAGACKISPAPV